MKQLNLHLLAFVGCAFLAAAQSPPLPPSISRLRPIGPIHTGELPFTVTLYEDASFGGRSKSVGVGDYRLSDFEGIASSIRVPLGFVAILYEHADEGGGYGISVDLLEDCPDLSKYNLNDKAAYISVFSATRDGLFWARNSMRNGQFNAGHWERPRAGGNPVNTVAVASPPIPSRAPPAPTSIQHQGTTWTITTLGPQSAGDAAQWSRANPTMGVIGSDFRGPQEIGSAQFERASNNALIPDWLNFWFPSKQPNDHRSIVYFKRTLTGLITDKITKNWSEVVIDAAGRPQKFSGTYELSDVPHIANISGTYPDFDLNIDVAPTADYMYLINDSHKPERSTEVKMKDLVDDNHDPCTDPFIKVEAEIDTASAAKQSLVNSLQARIGKQIAMYGPWIYDIGHCDHPEIHPAEEIWWTDNNGPNNSQLYHLNVFADSSKRFWWRSQMDDGTKLHPWGAPPITGLFAIAFEVPIDTTRVGTVGGKRFEVSTVDFYNVVPVPDSNKVFNLVYKGNTLVSFVPHNDTFKVSYENVGLKPGTSNIVHGFLVIETTVGTVKQIATKVNIPPLLVVDVPEGADPDKIDQKFEQAVFQKVAGHYMFIVEPTDIGGQVPPLR